MAAAEKEDDPNGPSPDGEEVDLSLLEAQDAADAEAVLTQLMRTAANVEVTTDSEACRVQVGQLTAGRSADLASAALPARS